MTKEHIERKLTIIWDKFSNKFENEDLNKVLDRKFVYTLPEKSDILITGINPSFREGSSEVPISYKLSDAKHSYFTTLRKIAPVHNGHTSYLDLFHFKNTEQAILSKFYLEKDLGLSFLAEQLNLTQHIIEWIAPKVILVMNKGSWGFWGKESNCTWMGYEMEMLNESLNFGQLCQISGLRLNNDRVAPEIGQTSLKGTKVYFSRHLNRISNEQLELLKAEIASIVI